MTIDNIDIIFGQIANIDCKYVFPSCIVNIFQQYNDDAIRRGYDLLVINALRVP